MQIAITGSAGMIGRHLSAHFRARGDKVVPIDRGLLYGDLDLLAQALEGSEVLVHLSGAPLLARWTIPRKKEIYESRVLTTRTLAAALDRMERLPRLFIGTSAVGIYDDSMVQTEVQHHFADDFSGEICRAWEEAVSGVPSGCRTVIFRLGVVLDKNGGALKRMLPVFRAGLGGRIATGKQILSWVHIEDVLRAYDFALSHPLEGAVNLCAPESVSNAVFTKTLSRILKRPAIIPLPAFLLRMIYGAAVVLLVKGQQVIPERLSKSGFIFNYPEIKQALEHILC